MVVTVADVAVPFLIFLRSLSCRVSSGFTDFCSTFDNFTPFVCSAPHIPGNLGRYRKISWKPSVCIRSAFSGLLGSTYSETVGRRAVDVWFSVHWLVHHFCLFVLKRRPKLSQAIENLLTLFCMLALVVVFIVQLLTNRNSLTISVFT